MNRKLIGEIIQINRYPVKSLAGERLNHVDVRTNGLLGDRSHAFIDATKEGWNRYITARQIPELLHYRAELDIHETADEYARVKITGLDGMVYEWDEHLHKEI